MDKVLFSKIVKRLGKTDLDDFSYEDKKTGKLYGFEITGSDNWEDDGKYSNSEEKGILVEFSNDGEYKKVKSFNFGVCRCVSRCGSYFTDYHYTYYDYDFFEIKEVLIPEVVIPAHIEEKWNAIEIDVDKIVDEEKEEEERLRIEKEQKEAEVKAEEDRLRKLYTMNNSEIIKKVGKILKKKGFTFTIRAMRQEYFDLVVKGKLESQDWIDYYTKILEKE